MISIRSYFGGRSDQLLRPIAVAGFLLTLAVGVLVPVYTDEIGWRFQERAGIDGVDKMYSDLCGPNTLARPPWFMMPVRWFSAAANQAFADPLFIRLEGLICAFIWALLFWTLTRRLEPDQLRRARLQALGFAVLGLGTLPYILVLSRPEQPLVLTYTAMCVIAFTGIRALGPAKAAWLKAAGIVVLFAIAASYNLKSVVYAPLALGCLAVCAKGRGALAPRLICAAGVIGLMATSIHYWVGRFQCPGDHQLAAKLGAENLASVLANRGHLGDVAQQALVGALPLQYVWLTAPVNHPLSSWLPTGLFPLPIFVLLASMLILLWIAALGLAIFWLISFLSRERMRALAEPRALLAVIVFACVLVWGASQLNKNVYEAGHVLPMLAIFIALCLTLPVWQSGRFRGVLDGLVRFAVPGAILGEIILVALTAGPLMLAARTPGYLPRQPFSVSIGNYALVRRDIGRAMDAAGIDSRQPLKRLLVDDITYLALQRHEMPFHRLGVLSVWNGSIENPAKYLADRGSDGAVMACSNLPLNMAMAAASSGKICALSGATLRDMAKPVTSIWSDELETSP